MRNAKIYDDPVNSFADDISVEHGGFLNYARDQELYFKNEDGVVSKLMHSESPEFISKLDPITEISTNGGGNHVFISRPLGGEFSEDGGSSIGAIRITLPNIPQTMIMFYLDFFNFKQSGSEFLTFMLAGFMRPLKFDGATSLQVGGVTKYEVRFGDDGTNKAIQIGGIHDEGFDYTKITIRDVTLGHNGGTMSNWREAKWEITKTRSLLNNVDTLILNNVVIN